MYSPNTPLTENKSLVLSFSVEELTLMTAAMHIPSFLGFRPPARLPGAAAQAAERSLRLRQFARVGEEGKFVVDINVARLLSVCAVPEHTLVIMPDFTNTERYFSKEYEDDPKPRLHFFCVNGSDMVYHNRTQPGLHTFATMTSPDMLKMMLAAALEMQDIQAVPETEQGHYEVDKASLLHAEGLAAEGGKAAVYDRMINDLNAPPSLAQAIAEGRKHLFGLIWRNDWQEPGYAYSDTTLVENQGYIVLPALEGGFWIYTNTDAEPDMAFFESVSGVALIDEMVERLHQAMGVA